MKYNLENLIKLYNSNEKLKYIFFWGNTPPTDGRITKACLSQWWDCRFQIDDIEYHTAEQYMMAQKALLFNDKEVFEKIMQSSHPNEYKKLGRMIKNFDENIWNENRCSIVIKGNTAKFSQNEALKNFLIGTNKRILVEASPMDKIWGIGLAENDNRCFNPQNWNGINLLGFCLMEVRDNILLI